MSANDVRQIKASGLSLGGRARRSVTERNASAISTMHLYDGCSVASIFVDLYTLFSLQKLSKAFRKDRLSLIPDEAI